MKKYNIIYKTTCLVNGRQYVGSHSTDNLDDGYLGSGLALLKSIKQYGKEQFIREVLEFCDSREDAFHKEAEYIKKLDTLQPKGYNISPKGGKNINYHSIEARKKMAESGRKKVFTKKHRRNIAQSNSKVVHGTEWNRKVSQSKTGVRITCPHCGVSMDPGNAKKHHFDNCKHKHSKAA